MAYPATQKSGPPLAENIASSVVEMLRVPAITCHAFCETPETTAAMEAAAADRRMSHAHATVQPGGIAAALELYRRTPTPDLVMFESHATDADLFVQLDALANVCSAS